MVKIFVDTCVWRHWFSFKHYGSIENHFFNENAKAFDKIYKKVFSSPDKFLFLYNSRIEGELPDKYLFELPFCFQQIKDKGFMKKIPVPLSRADGTYRADGSVLACGDYGGTIIKILSIGGNNHLENMSKAKPNFKKENPAHTKHRKKEFDIEHLESALHACANMFFTDDTKLINRLDSAKKVYPEDKEIDWARKISFYPVEALSKFKLE